jgi:hypothetical protein
MLAFCCLLRHNTLKPARDHSAGLVGDPPEAESWTGDLP